LHTHAVTAGEPCVWQVEPAPQTWPQLPQLKSSLARFTHVSGVPVQSVGAFAGQPHVPVSQMPLSAHACPQVPQFAGSLVRSAQPDVHAVSAVAQAQFPPVQIAFVPHAVPQVPQLFGSVCLSVHAEPQTSGEDAGHAQFADEQVCPVKQGRPHPPQLLASV